MITEIKALVELFAYLYCLSELFGKKMRISIHLVVYVILDMFLLAGINQYGFPEYLLSLSYLGMFLYALIYYGESIKLTLVNSFLAAALVAILQLLVLFPLYYLFFIRYGQSDMNELLINIVCFLIIVLCSYKIELKRISDFFIRRNKVIIGASMFIFLGFVIKSFQIKNAGDIYGEVYIQMIYFFFIFSFIIYEWQKTKTDAERKKAQLEMNSLYSDAYDQLITLVRVRQHDMKSHINAILSMVYMTDDYEELVKKQKEYCGYVMEQNEKTRLVLSTGNPLISGFLYSKIREAEDKKIEFEYHVGIKGTDTIVPEYELIEMMGILVDNAIEELGKDEEENDKAFVEEGKRTKKICLSLKEIENEVEISVANTSVYYEDDMTEHFFEAGYSSKGKSRGIGLPKLKRMVHNKRGSIIVSNELHEDGNYLTFTIRIPKNEKK